MNALVFGEVLWDVYSNSKHLGGAPLNFASHFKKNGGESWIITAVGNDFLGHQTVDEIEKMGVHTEYVTYKDKETGKCIVTLDNNQIPTYDLLNYVAYDYIDKPDFTADRYDVLYFGTLSLRNENNKNVLKQIISENVFEDIFVDMNIRSPYYCKEVINLAFENATIVKLSDEELPVVFEQINSYDFSIEESVRIISDKYKNLKLIIITCGAEGSLVYDCINKKTYKQKAQKVEAVSTVGAGDSFSASFLARYLKSDNIASALDIATKISGYVVSCTEAIPDYDMNDFD